MILLSNFWMSNDHLIEFTKNLKIKKTIHKGPIFGLNLESFGKPQFIRVILLDTVPYLV